MSLKNFNINIKKNTFLEKKILSYDLYSKAFVRKSDNKGVCVVDYGLFPTNVFYKDVVDTGSSFFPKKSSLFHKFNKDLKLESFLPFLSIENSLVPNLLGNLKIISTAPTSLRTLLFLNPVKGGFKVYSFGAVGFMPKSHVLLFLNQFYSKYILVSNFKKDHFTLVNKSVDMLYNFNIYYKYFFLRIPYSSVGVRISSFTKKRSFSGLKSVYYNKKNSLNFVFLSKKPKSIKKMKNEKPASKNFKKLSS